MRLPDVLNGLRITTRLWILGGVPLLSIAILFVTDSLRSRADLVTARETALRQVVETASGVLAHYEAEARQGRISEDEAKQRAIATMRAMRYDRGEYLWINDTGTPQPRMVMHPILPGLEGKVLTEERFNRATTRRAGLDGPEERLDNENLFSAFVGAVERDGRGYVGYVWPRPKAGGGATTETYPKLSFVQRFAPWGWIVGSGVYIDDIDARFRADLIQRGGIMAGLLLLGGGLGLLITRSVSRGFVALDHDIDLVHSGGATSALLLSPDRRDEFAKVASILGEMADNRAAVRRMEEERRATERAVELERADTRREVLRSLVQAAILGNEAMITLARMKHEIDLSSNNVTAMAQAIEQMRDSISAISADSTEAAVGAGTAGTAASGGLGASRDAAQAFERIVSAVSSAGARVEGLVDASAQIGNIVTAIEGVAGQTNLLALNATIEAARAGEAGKGFAVVAGEVKTLANQTAKATIDIRERIESLQNEMGTIVSAIGESTDAVTQGRTLVESLGARLQNIAGEVESVQTSMTRISTVLEGQSQTASGLADGTTVIVRQAQTSDAMLGTVLDVMSRMSQHLDSQVGSYADLGSASLLVEIAKNDHVAFKRRVLDAVLGRIRLGADDIPDHHACRLGQWYDAFPDAEIRRGSAFAAICEPHQAVHAAAKTALTLAAAGKTDEALAAIETMNQASGRVVERLDALSDQLHSREKARGRGPD